MIVDESKLIRTLQTWNYKSFQWIGEKSNIYVTHALSVKHLLARYRISEFAGFKHAMVIAYLHIRLDALEYREQVRTYLRHSIIEAKDGGFHL